MADAVDINAARGNVGRNQDRGLALLEIVQCTNALVLALVAVDRLSIQAFIGKVADHFVSAMLGAGEHDGAVHVVLRQDFGQQARLGRTLYHIDRLVDLFGRLGNGGDGHFGRIAQEIIRKRADFLRHSRREEQRLAARRNGLHHLTDRRQEAHIHHLIGFIQHDRFGTAQIHGAGFHMVQQTSRCCHQYVHAACQRTDLSTGLHAAHDNRRGQLHLATINAHAFGDLGGQLTRRRQNQDASRLGDRAARIGGHTAEQRQHESCGLAGAGLGNAHKVAAFQQCRDRLFLNRSRLGIALSSNRLEDGLGEAEFGKLCQINTFMCGRPADSKVRAPC